MKNTEKSTLIPRKQNGGYVVKNGNTSDKLKAGLKLIIPSNDKTIGDTENYGWTHPTDRGWYNKNRLQRTVDPGTGFEWGDYINNGFHYAFNITQNNKTNLGNKYDRAFFHRHLGFPRDYSLMPITNIRFSGDFNEDGTPKFPNAEYVGIDGPTKGFIKEGIKRGYIKINKDGFWTPKEETRRNHAWTNKTSHFANYAIRENNDSGIYDVFDTYDFREGIANRLPGYQIEIRDTIHGPNARPELYDINFSTKKAEQRKSERLKNNSWWDSLMDYFE